MPASRSFVAIDLGATSGRLMLSRFEKGRLSLREVHRFPNQPVSYNRELHWDMPRIWSEIQEGLRALDGFGVGHVESIGVDTWGLDYALLGQGGSLIENPYHYRDSRTDGVMERVCARAGAARIYAQTGIQFMPINTLYQLCAAYERTPRLLEAADALVTVPDLLNFWLTGVLACEYTNASTTQFLAQDTKLWAIDLLRELGLPTHFLTRVIPPGTVLGGLAEGVADAAALARTNVIAPACHDTGSAIASIRASGDTAFISSGTWSLLGTEVPRAFVSGASRELNFTNEGGVCGTVRLLKNITGLWLLEGCRKKWTAEGRDWSWADLLAMGERAPSSRSLIDPDDAAFVRPADMTAAIDEFCRSTGQPVPSEPGHYVRTVLESLALKYRRVLEQLECVTGTTFRTIRVIGGGARNDMLNRLTAGVTGRTVIAGPVEATALGNIAMQMLASGAAGSLDEARDVIERSEPPARFEPAGDAWDIVYSDFTGLLERRVEFLARR
jgi:rhamnulokinase